MESLALSLREVVSDTEALFRRDDNPTTAFLELLKSPFDDQVGSSPLLLHYLEANKFTASSHLTVGFIRHLHRILYSHRDPILRTQTL
jgi:hypothetical protein